MINVDFAALHASLLLQIENRLQQLLSSWLTQKVAPNNQQHLDYLLQAMRYSVLGGGKRVRMVLAVASYCMLSPSSYQLLIMNFSNKAAITDNDVNLSTLLNLAASIEFIHGYSLIHDDLPAMDDDDYRRGKPSCHKRFGEAIAILAADALQSFAFEVIANDRLADGIGVKETPALTNKTRLHALQLLAEHAGIKGMVGGQAIDCLSLINDNLWCAPQAQTLAKLQEMHGLKTGALIKTAMLFGYLLAQGVNNNPVNEELLFTNDVNVGNDYSGSNTNDNQLLLTFKRIAASIGVLFQIVDDILDVTVNSHTLGKTAGKDEKNAKVTYVSVLGLHSSQKLAKTQYEDICDDLKSYWPNDCEFLLYLVDGIYKRSC